MRIGGYKCPLAVLENVLNPPVCALAEHQKQTTPVCQKFGSDWTWNPHTPPLTLRDRGKVRNLASISDLVDF